MLRFAVRRGRPLVFVGRFHSSLPVPSVSCPSACIERSRGLSVAANQSRRSGQSRRSRFQSTSSSNSSTSTSSTSAVNKRGGVKHAGAAAATATKSARKRASRTSSDKRRTAHNSASQQPRVEPVGDFHGGDIVADPALWASGLAQAADEAGCSPHLVAAVAKVVKGFAGQLSDVQVLAVPALLDPLGPDVGISAPTGTGKTLAYAVPMLQRVLDGLFDPQTPLRPRHVRALIVVPTRELAVQTQQVLESLLEALEDERTGGIYSTILDRFSERRETEVVQGELRKQSKKSGRGVSRSTALVALLASGEKRRGQRNALKACAIAVGTPRRIMDLLDSGHIELDDLDLAIFDECDALLTPEKRRVDKPTAFSHGIANDLHEDGAAPRFIDEETADILNAVSRVRRRRRKKSMRHMNSATSDSVTKRASHETAAREPAPSPRMCFVAATCSARVRDRLDTAATAFLHKGRLKTTAVTLGVSGAGSSSPTPSSKPRGRGRFVHWLDKEPTSFDLNFGILPPGLQQNFCFSAQPSGKPGLLIQTLRQAGAGDPRQRTLVFCHSANSVRFVEKYIAETYNAKLSELEPTLEGDDDDQIVHSSDTAHDDTELEVDRFEEFQPLPMPEVFSLHGGMSPSDRVQALQRFTQDITNDTFSVDHGQILVTSDLAMRGIDFQGASHVVIFDFPTSAAEYIHMAGRTARAGADGVVTVLWTKRDRGLARVIQQGEVDHGILAKETGRNPSERSTNDPHTTSKSTSKPGKPRKVQSKRKRPGSRRRREIKLHREKMKAAAVAAAAASVQN